MPINKPVALGGGLALALIVVVGCSRDTKLTAETGTFAIVDGVPVTAKELRETVLLRAKMAELSNRKIPENGFVRWANGYAMRILPGLIQANVLERALKSRGIVPSPESETTMLDKYNKMTKQKAKSLDELAVIFGDLAPTFRSQVARESLFDTYFNSSPETRVSEQDFRAYYRAQSNLLMRCEQISANGWKKAHSAYEALKVGKSWEDVAKAVSEDADVEPTNADNWKDWMTIPISKIEPKELADAVEKLTDGQYTKPIDIDEGLVIVRLNSRDGEVCNLARILIRMGRKMEVPSREEAEKEIRAEKWRELQMRDLAQARKDFKVEYLFTTNFSYKIWKEEPPQKGKRRSGAN